MLIRYLTIRDGLGACQVINEFWHEKIPQHPTFQKNNWTDESKCNVLPVLLIPHTRRTFEDSPLSLKVMETACVIRDLSWLLFHSNVPFPTYPSSCTSHSSLFSRPFLIQKAFWLEFSFWPHLSKWIKNMCWKLECSYCDFCWHVLTQKVLIIYFWKHWINHAESWSKNQYY